ncbi:DUF4142 domain-containing protein [Sphingomonas immobilis]|uniref:DUF4142 domain-containing protein n=1 Tax=Sphingomonas immobilis TaxID=3063997 RepID=A0ABT8ZW64_9SPHN|nr:DUF4142 domain-containing protein [Sphingomonas sp. CA1-15]MDO7841811.1 DUF4142 domain-containing protein [Sphingomonas sp. CA1-15]
MKIKSLVLLSAATLTLSACGHKTESTDVTSNATTVSDTTTNTVAVAPAPAASGGQTFANTAASSDAFEIATSKAALETSTSASVKKFAQMMIDAHTKSTDKLKSTAAGLSPAITPDPTLTADQQSKLDALKTLKGADFDKAYIDAQTGGHQQTLDALKAYAATGDVPALKAFASDLVPTVTAHLNMAKGLKA